MSERYWVTGVQLAMITYLKTEKEKIDFVNKIVDEQFIGNEKDLLKAEADMWRGQEIASKKRKYIKQRISPHGDAMKFFKATKHLWVSKDV